MAQGTLADIETKVRKLTRSPNESSLTQTQLREYINTAVLNDFPRSLRLFSLRSTLTFYTQPFVDKYSTETTDVNNPLYDFKNKVVAVHTPVYAAGIQVFYTQKRDIFYGYYPQFNNIASTNVFVDGTTGPFSGTITAHPMLQHNVMLTVGQAGNGLENMILIDYPIDNQDGYLALPESDPVANPIQRRGTLNYVTGAFTVTFPAATVAGEPIVVTNIAYQPGKPLAILYYDNEFTIRPVPDRTYMIQLDVDLTPVELIASNQEPKLRQWWEYIAYLAARKILEDRMDVSTLQMLIPSLERQEALVASDTMTQQAEERTTTIYTVGKQYAFGPGWWQGQWPY